MGDTNSEGHFIVYIYSIMYHTFTTFDAPEDKSHFNTLQEKLSVLTLRIAKFEP